MIKKLLALRNKVVTPLLQMKQARKVTQILMTLKTILPKRIKKAQKILQRHSQKILQKIQQKTRLKIPQKPYQNLQRTLIKKAQMRVQTTIPILPSNHRSKRPAIMIAHLNLNLHVSFGGVQEVVVDSHKLHQKK